MAVELTNQERDMVVAAVQRARAGLERSPTTNSAFATIQAGDDIEISVCAVRGQDRITAKMVRDTTRGAIDGRATFAPLVAQFLAAEADDDAMAGLDLLDEIDAALNAAANR